MADSVEIIGTGASVPDRIVTNDDIRDMGVDTNDEWITTRTGIKQRRIADADTATSHLGAEAARRAMADAGVTAEEIDLIVVATCTPDMFFPSTACLVQHMIGAKSAVAFDINAACSGFIYGMEIVCNHLANYPGRTALLIGAEKLSSMINWEDRSTCVLFGDGAGAVVLRATNGNGNRGMIDCVLGADGGLADLLLIPGGGSRSPTTPENVADSAHKVKMEGREVFKHAVTTMTAASSDLVQRNGLDHDDIALVIPHQANRRIISAIQERLELPDEKMMVNVDRYGNTSAASIIIALDEAAKEGRVTPGDVLLFVAFGAGFTWGACLLEWSKKQASRPQASQRNGTG